MSLQGLTRRMEHLEGIAERRFAVWVKSLSTEELLAEIARLEAALPEQVPAAVEAMTDDDLERLALECHQVFPF